MARRAVRTIRVVLVACVVAAIALALWRLTRPAPHRRPVVTTAPSRGLDVAAFRTRLAARRAAARALQRQHPARPPAPGATRSAMASMALAGRMVEPQCILGPADLCATIAEPVDACDQGDASACLAVGQYLQDNPPRPLIALSFFLYACRRGDQAGCDRVAELKALPATPLAPCDDDPMACAWQGYRGKDADQLDHACAAGVADACAWLSERAEPARQRTYLELSCELGNPMACVELGRRLSPGCDEDCYPPDPAAAAAASTIACEVGFTDACDRLPAP